jgi:hypothetical protein
MWDAVPVDECIIQLEFEHKVPQTILDGYARLVSTIGAARKNAQGIGSASIHECWWWLMVEDRKGENFWLWAETRNASRRVDFTRKVILPEANKHEWPDKQLCR